MDPVSVYLPHKSHAVHVCGVQVSAVQCDLNLSQEGIAAEATMMPHWYQQGAGEQLRAADGVLLEGDEVEKTGWIKRPVQYCYSGGDVLYNFNAVVLREV